MLPLKTPKNLDLPRQLMTNLTIEKVENGFSNNKGPLRDYFLDTNTSNNKGHRPILCKLFCFYKFNKRAKSTKYQKITKYSELFQVKAI